MSKQYEVAVVGEIFADHIFFGFPVWPEPGVEIFTDRYTREVGGGAANTATALATLGRRTVLCGLAGCADQAWFSSRLQGFGVGLDGVRFLQEGTGVTVSISTLEDRTFFTYPGLNRQLGSYLQDPCVVALLLQAAHVHFAMPLSAVTAHTLLPRLKQAGCTLSIDVGWQPQWLGDPQNLDTCRTCDYFLPNEKEAAFFTGAQEPAKMLQACVERGILGTVVKLGSKGAVGMLNGNMHSAASIEVLSADTTGAGDAFNAGLIDALLDRLSLDAMLRRACICGALSTRASGALNSLPTRKELSEIYEQAIES